MSDALINHLWQSTLCALAAGLLVLAFQKNGARIRFYIWLAASMKFLIPFSLFVSIGALFRWGTEVATPASGSFSSLMDQIAQPAAALTTNIAAMPAASAALDPQWSGWMITFSLWLLGAIALLCRRVYQWLYLLAVAKTSTPLDLDTPIQARETASTLEPGVFGIFRPVLLLPAGISKQLTAAQLDAIVAHELCHWRRRDNLTAALHMLVEALFWFHPLVWWLGAKLIEERERACDESVLESGGDRQAYAEGILKICQRYVEPPVCSAGVSGGTLRKRIEQIMSNPIRGQLSLAKKSMLAGVAFMATAGPLAIGATSRADAGADPHSISMRHYKNDQWKFELDVPKQWVVMPPVPTNSPTELIRFWSYEKGDHGLIIFRNPTAPDQTPEKIRELTQQVLARAPGGAFTNFVPGETKVGSRRVLTLDFLRTSPDGTVGHCRHYFVIDGNVTYVLGFGTTAQNIAPMFDVFERVVQSFEFEEI